MKPRSLFTRALWLLLCLALVACHAPLPPPDVGSLTFTDALGRTVTVARQPLRVAALLGSFADVWVLAGGTLCAAAEDAWEDFGLTQTDAINIGGAHSPSTELLLASEPELVIASASTASHVELMETLEALHVPVAYFDVDCFEDYLAMLRICTDLTGRDDLYEQHGLQLLDRIQAVRAQYAQEATDEQSRRVLLLRASSTSIKAKGSSGTILGEMLADLGCINIADNESTLLEQLSVEHILHLQPHHIFVVTMGSNTELALQSLENMIKENPALGELEAIRKGRLHVMDKSLFNLKPNAHWADAYEILYETLTTP